MIFRFEVEFENQMQERNRRLGFVPISMQNP